jgi:hypothetical protein
MYFASLAVSGMWRIFDRPVRRTPYVTGIS